MKMQLRTILHSSFLSYSALLLNFIFATLVIYFTNKSTYALVAHATAYLTIGSTLLTFGHLRSFVRYDGTIKELTSVASIAIIYWLSIISLMTVTFIYFYVNLYNLISISLVLMVASSIFIALLLPLWQWTHQVIQFNYWISGLGLSKVLVTLLLWIFPNNTELLFSLNAFISIVFAIVMILNTQLFNFRTFFSYNKFKGAMLSLIKHTYMIGFPFWLSLIASTIYIRVDIILLNALHISQDKIGLYAYVEMIIFAVLLLPGAISNIITRPLISKQIDGKMFWQQYEHILILVSCALSLITMILLPTVVHVLLGDVSNSKSIVEGFVPGIAFAFLSTFFNLALITDNHLGKVAYCNIFTALSCVILNLFLISLFGVVGAAYATSITYCILSSSFLLFALKEDAWQFKSSRNRLVLINFMFCLGFISWLFYFIIPLFVLWDKKKNQ